MLAPLEGEPSEVSRTRGGVIGANLVQQCIKAGLLDEIHLDMVPVVLGGGVGLFDHLSSGPIELERTRVIEGAGVTHLTFRVV